MHQRPSSAAVPLAALLLLLPGRAQAQCTTNVSTAVVNTTWTPQGSPYCVNQNIQVSQLTIQPGVVVRVAPGVTITVVSWLRVVGTRTNPVVFEAQNLAAGRWSGLLFQGPVLPQNPSSLTFCVVRGAGNSGIRIADNNQVSLTACHLRNNLAPGAGGGISIQLTGGSISLQDCEIANNQSASHGGGIDAVLTNGASLTMDRCTIRDNTATNASTNAGSLVGGGLRVDGDATLRNCLFRGNRIVCAGSGGVFARGGAIHAASGSLDVQNCLILNNLGQATNHCCGGGTATTDGAGLYFANPTGTLAVTNSLIACNQGTSLGQNPVTQSSGLYSMASNTSVVNCTIARNGSRGAVFAGGAATLHNSIVYFNGAAQVQGTVTTCYSNVQGGVTGCSGNINFNPGFTGTACLPEHFSLLPFSPSIDAGDPTPAHNDACFPSSSGSARNDMGALGGPGACNFRAPCLMVCAGQTIGEQLAGANTMTLDWTFLSSQPPHLGDMVAASGPPNTPGLLILGLGEARTAFGLLTIVIDPAQPFELLPIALDAAGGFRLQVPLQLPSLVGLPLYFQVIARPPGGTVGSNGLKLSTCF